MANIHFIGGEKGGVGKSLVARVVSIRHLRDAVINKIDATSSSFWAAQNAADRESTGLGLLDRQRVKTWMREAYLQLDAAGV